MLSNLINKYDKRIWDIIMKLPDVRICYKKEVKNLRERKFNR